MLIILLLLLAQAFSATEAITGEIRDAKGKPRAGMRVAVVELFDSKKDVRFVSFSTTDDRGRYRIADVAPGRYLIVAGPLNFPTYYPGTNKIEDAKIVTVVRGAPQVIDFAVVRDGWKVEGKVFSARSDLSLPKIVLLQDIDSATSPALGAAQRQTAVDAEGWFVFTDVLPGEYWVVPNPPGLQTLDANPSASRRAELERMGQALIKVEGDVNGVALTVGAPPPPPRGLPPGGNTPLPPWSEPFNIPIR
jgi:hypothetical protein